MVSGIWGAVDHIIKRRARFTDEQLDQIGEAIYAEFVARWSTDDWDAEGAAEKLADDVVKELRKC